MKRFFTDVFLILIMGFVVYGFFLTTREPPCPKIVYELRGEVAFARDCNGGEWRSIPPRYGTYRVYQVGEEL
jgi:hypothetical protein